MISLSNTPLKFTEAHRNPFDFVNLPPWANFFILPPMFESIINFTLSHQSVQDLMNEKFDMVIVEVFHSEALLGKF